MGRSYQLAGLLTGIVVAGILAFVPIFGSTVVRGAPTSTLNLHHGAGLAKACRLYAQDHGGHFPVHLSDLQPDYLSDVHAWDTLIVDDQGERTSEHVDWLYFGSGFSDSAAPTLLIASAQVFEKKGKGKRITIRGDASGAVIPEEDYQALLAKTIEQMRAIDQKRRDVIRDSDAGRKPVP